MNHIAISQSMGPEPGDWRLGLRRLTLQARSGGWVLQACEAGAFTQALDML